MKNQSGLPVGMENGSMMARGQVKNRWVDGLGTI